MEMARKGGQPTEDVFLPGAKSVPSLRTAPGDVGICHPDGDGEWPLGFCYGT